ncbi:hypothetical protein UK23_33275 [Lentzea aerocolonigenes]|uniref:Lipoprotein n=1 Tax=Lentzea aerocolonigenes TaxID=68170 RepID=A0A0F0GNC4_LENAE|nr:hypothetical protein [Lentzea aerocolonigenes]KJK43442.1 hypothetical protein UK23_33275 [Lentzea aerocolonigenes]
MSRIALLALVLAGCGQAAPPAAPPSSTSTSTTTTTTTTTSTPPTASPAAAAQGVDYASCTDGTCEVFVNGEVTIPLAPEFGFTTFVVTRTPDLTKVFGGDPVNGNLRAEIGGKGHLNSNGITMEVVISTESGAVLRFSPRKD